MITAFEAILARSAKTDGSGMVVEEAVALGQGISGCSDSKRVTYLRMNLDFVVGRKPEEAKMRIAKHDYLCSRYAI
jgi:hypothetical protein